MNLLVAAAYSGCPSCSRRASGSGSSTRSGSLPSVRGDRGVAPAVPVLDPVRVVDGLPRVLGEEYDRPRQFEPLRTIVTIIMVVITGSACRQPRSVAADGLRSRRRRICSERRCSSCRRRCACWATATGTCLMARVAPEAERTRVTSQDHRPRHAGRVGIAGGFACAERTEGPRLLRRVSGVGSQPSGTDHEERACAGTARADRRSEHAPSTNARRDRFGPTPPRSVAWATPRSKSSRDIFAHLSLGGCDIDNHSGIANHRARPRGHVGGVPI